jgi:DNA-binding transcriptional MerR regulator/methylmalonyl-CoA mutase cobalamin-binding subunit
MKYGHPIGVVSKRTGMSPHLIRIWERRYAAVNPIRTDAGRRLYTEADIERLNLLRLATIEGETISQIARLDEKQLRELIPKKDKTITSAISGDTKIDAEHYLAQSLQLMKNFDAAGLETHLLRASIRMGLSEFNEQLLHPLLKLTGDMWEDGRFQVAHEHLASAVVRSFLGAMYLSGSPDSSAPLLLSTTPQGQIHEFGALMALVSAASIGWKTLYLGPNLPAADIAAAAKDSVADAIALSIVYPADDPYLATELRKIYDLTGGKMPIIIGGRSAASYGKIIKEIDAILIPDLTDLKNKLKVIGIK